MKKGMVNMRARRQRQSHSTLHDKHPRTSTPCDRPLATSMGHSLVFWPASPDSYYSYEEEED